MPNLRWLVTMDVQSDLDGPGMSYRLWLTELDQLETPSTTMFHTVDALFAALTARCEHQMQTVIHKPAGGASLPDIALHDSSLSQESI